MSYRVLLLVAFGHMVVDLHQGALPVVLPLLRETYNLSYAMLTSLVMIMQAVSSVFQPAVGLFSDRLSFRRLIPLSCLLAGLGYLFLLGDRYALFAAGMFLTGIGVAAYHPEGSKIAHYVSGDRKGWALSIFAVGGNVGMSLAPVVMGMLLAFFGLRGVAGMLGVAAVAAAIFLWFTPVMYASVPDAKARNGSDPSAGDWRQAVLPVTVLLLMIVLRSWTHISLVTFVPLYFVSHLGMSPQFGSALLSAYLLTGAVSTLIVGALADRWGAMRTVLTVLILGLPLVYWFPSVRGPLAFVVLALTGATVSSTHGVTTAMGQRLLPGHVGLASGLMLGATVGTGGFGAVLVGYLADLYGMDSAVKAIAVFLLLAVALGFLLLALTRRRTGTVPAAAEAAPAGTAGRGA